MAYELVLGACASWAFVGHTHLKMKIITFKQQFLQKGLKKVDTYQLQKKVLHIIDHSCYRGDRHQNQLYSWVPHVSKGNIHLLLSKKREQSWLHRPKHCWQLGCPDDPANSPEVPCQWQWPAQRIQTWRTWQVYHFWAPSPWALQGSLGHQLDPEGQNTFLRGRGPLHPQLLEVHWCGSFQQGPWGPLGLPRLPGCSGHELG